MKVIRVSHVCCYMFWGLRGYMIVNTCKVFGTMFYRKWMVKSVSHYFLAILPFKYKNNFWVIQYSYTTSIFLILFSNHWMIDVHLSHSTEFWLNKRYRMQCANIFSVLQSINIKHVPHIQIVVKTKMSSILGKLNHYFLNIYYLAMPCRWHYRALLVSYDQELEKSCI